MLAAAVSAASCATGCFSGGSSSPHADARMIGPPDGEPTDAGSACGCNPVAQVGCEVGEKCTYVRPGANLIHGLTTCVPDGTVAFGRTCAHSPTTDVDDCARGGWCADDRDGTGVCREICVTGPDSCPLGETCTPQWDAFLDVPYVGLCRTARGRPAHAHQELAPP